MTATTTSLQADFEKMLALSLDMHAAATAREWERFIAFEAEQGALVASMQGKSEPAMTEDQTAARRSLISEIIAMQAKVTELVIPQRDMLASMIQSVMGARHELHVANAYQAENNRGDAL